MTIHPLAGKPAPKHFLVDVDKLQKEYYARPYGVEDVYRLYAESFPGSIREGRFILIVFCSAKPFER